MAMQKTTSRKKIAVPHVSRLSANSKRPMACKVPLQTEFAS